jgi:hypothetical protein
LGSGLIDTMNVRGLKGVKMGRHMLDLTNLTINSLLVIERIGKTKNGESLWKCKCLVCGNESIKRTDHIQEGQRCKICLGREIRMEEYKIEKGIPVPERRFGVGKLYPFDGMKVGDSFFIPCETKELQKSLISNVHASKKHRGEKLAHVKITCRKVEGGVRCWRYE